MSTPQIDWTKPVQASLDKELGAWFPARVLCSLKGGGYAVAVDYGQIEGVESVNSGGTSLTAIVRNTPAPPVPFERNLYMNVRRLNDGSLDISPDTYGTCETAMMYARHGFVTVPVTIRGEWKDGESNG